MNKTDVDTLRAALHAETEFAIHNACVLAQETKHHEWPECEITDAAELARAVEFAKAVVAATIDEACDNATDE